MYVATPATASATTATSAHRSHETEAKRHPQPSDVRVAQHVADEAHRVDQRRTELVELLAQVADVRLEDVRVAVEVVVPDMIEDLRLGQHPARVEHEEAQQVELGRGQLDRDPVAPHLVVSWSSTSIGERQPAVRVGTCAERALEDRVDAQTISASENGLVT